jgi:hypothetical protein
MSGVLKHGNDVHLGGIGIRLYELITGISLSLAFRGSPSANVVGRDDHYRRLRLDPPVLENCHNRGCNVKYRNGDFTQVRRRLAKTLDA